MGPTRHHCGRRWGAVLALLATSFPSLARAGDEDYALIVPIEATLSQWSAPAALALNGDAPHRIVGLPLRSASTLYGLGAAVGLMVRADVGEGGWVFGGYQEFARASYSWSAASGPSSQRADGVAMSVTRDPENLLELSFPAIAGGGVFLAYGHFLVRAGFNWGWAYLWTYGHAVRPSGTTLGGSADAGSAFVRIPLAMCLLGRSFTGAGVLAKGQDACLTFSPAAYEFGWLTGWSAGLRVDL